jgi:hypothetical protein
MELPERKPFYTVLPVAPRIFQRLRLSEALGMRAGQTKWFEISKKIEDLMIRENNGEPPPQGRLSCLGRREHYLSFRRVLNLS